MSRIGNKPIPIPGTTSIRLEGRRVIAKGPHGELSLDVNSAVDILLEDAQIIVKNSGNSKDNKKYHGLYRSLINNMVIGVSEGFTRKLELVGVGYKAAVAGNELVLDVGYSTSKKLKIPEGIKVSIEKGNLITLWGIDKAALGQFAANVRAVRPPEPYKGKGIKYEEEKIRRKAGKAGTVGKGG